MLRNHGKALGLGLLTLFTIFLLLILYTDYKIQTLIQEKRFLAPTQYYARPVKFSLGQIQSPASFKAYFRREAYRERSFGQPILKGDYSLGGPEACSQIVKGIEGLSSCVFFKPRSSKELNLVALNQGDQIVGIFTGEELAPAPYAQAEAPLFAQYLGDQPTQQIKVSLGDIPRYCLDAVVAIEDPYFLEHRGISWSGLARAFVINLKQLRLSQGGSTITQQLVKNYFLTPEKTTRRKIKEIFISLLFELRVSKDHILETYLNIIYLGQSGVFQVRGYGAASQYYFQKDIERLNLAECSLLAAIVNNPGRYNPVKNPEKALERRKRVLRKMVEQERISQAEMEEALTKPLPRKVKASLSASAPYYVDGVNKKLMELGIKDRSGLRVYTALDPKAQQGAEKAVVRWVKRFETHYPRVKKLHEQEQKKIQATLVASHPVTGEVVALVGGRNFRSSPYNRAMEMKRQVGSVFKPIIYLTALQGNDSMGRPWTPLSLIDNSPYKLEYDNKVWEPQNYDHEFSAPLPLFFALKESKNIPTARLAMEVGLENIIETAQKLGVESPLKEYPSLALGAFELKALEVLKVYNSLSQMGLKQKLEMIKGVTNARGEWLYTHEPLSEQVLPPEALAVLMGMMKQTLISGTAKAAQKMGFHHTAAGKTGTTSDTKDAWFAGFTPFHSAVVWVGYDDGHSHGLTGASAALPIWVDYMKGISQQYPDQDFKFPEGVYKEVYSPAQLLHLNLPPEKAQETELIFRGP